LSEDTASNQGIFAEGEVNESSGWLLRRFSQSDGATTPKKELHFHFSRS
jgi:hypothetical protein